MNVYSDRNSRGRRIYNVAVRDSNGKYQDYPSIVEVASEKFKYQEFYGVKLDVILAEQPEQVEPPQWETEDT